MIEFDQLELNRFINKNLDLLARVMNQAGMTRMDYYVRNRDLAEYFGRPFGFPPPDNPDDLIK